MKERFFDGDIKLLCDKDIKYVFVLDIFEKVVKMVWEWIEEYIGDMGESVINSNCWFLVVSIEEKLFLIYCKKILSYCG